MGRLGRTLALLALLALGCSTAPPDAGPSSSASNAAPTPTAATLSAGPSATRAASPSGSPLALRTGPPALRPIGRFVEPVQVVAPPGDRRRLFVVERVGRVVVLVSGRPLDRPFLDIRDQVSSGGERGLLSLAFSPRHATDGLVYVNYTDERGDTRIVEYRTDRASPDRADPGSRRELLRIGQPYANHNGGLVLFDPGGMLVVGMGDGGAGGDPGNRAQNLGDLLGKLLRIDPRPSGGRPYRIPPDNPFVDRAGARPEIWAYGLRNPWRFSFDAETGDLYLGDVGQQRVEEIDAVPPGAQSGANFGWRAFEGDERFRDQRIDTSRLVRPLVVYGHDAGRCSVVGGLVYRGSVAALRGRYLYGDTCSGEVWSIPAGTRPGPTPRPEPFSAGQLVSFGEDGSGEAYVVSLGGDVWRIGV